MTDRYEKIRKVLAECRDIAMEWTLRGRIPECGKFGEIAQDLDAVCAELEITDPERAQHPAAAGEEVMVKTPNGVMFILPLQPSGRSIGPRFVVHVPLVEAPAVKALQAKIEALVEALETCLEMEERPKVIELARAALAAAQQQGQPAAVDEAKETDLWRCTVCGRVGTVGRCCGEETREPFRPNTQVQPCRESAAALAAQPAVSAEPVAWVAADTLNSPHPTCVSSLAYMSQLDKDRGREYVPLYAAPMDAQQAEIEALRAEVAEWKRVTAAKGEAEERAERLAEALRGWWESHRPVCWTEDQHRSCPHVNLATKAEKALATALLRGHDQEDRND